jgi:acetyltransferase-like isoleucine patch superfamily enzyme
MIIFRVRDYLSVLFYRVFCSIFFKKFGKAVRIVYPLRIIGSKYISFDSNVTIQYGSFIVAIKNGDFNPSLEINSGALIGNYSHIVCSKRILIQENVLTADKVFITDNIHDYRNIDFPIHEQKLLQLSEVKIGENSWIGENVSIIGASIGRHCVIGANSVVTKNIGDYTVAVGSPARPIKRYCFDSKKWRKTDSNSNFID